MSEVVHRAHEDGPDSVLQPAAPDGLDRARLEAVLTYCAERQCESAHVTCPGCRLRRNQEGIDSLDAFARAFARIEAEETGLTIVGGQGEATHRVASLENLARDWAGEEYWFWARRVLRKVRYGVRQTDELLDAPFAASDAPSILLMEPQIAENVGMAARAMANFGLDDLHIIKPRDGWPSEKARAVASGASAIIDGAGVHGNLGEAISDLHWVAATTARQRDLRKPVLTPEQAAAEMRRRTARGERCGILFGRERNGLQSDEVADCNAIVMIPVNRKFASLNLAQSVLLMGYAWLCSGSDATLGRVTDRERRLSTGLNLGHDVPAKQSDRERFFEHLETELDARGFFTPPERKPITVRNLRSMFLRADLTAQEVRTLRGIVVTLTRRPRNGHQSGQ